MCTTHRVRGGADPGSPAGGKGEGEREGGRGLCVGARAGLGLSLSHALEAVSEL